MLYLHIPYKKHVLRATVKKHGGKWNDYLRMWEIEKNQKEIPQNLIRYIQFDENDLSSYANNIAIRVKSHNPNDTLSIKETKFLQGVMRHGGNVNKAAEDINYKASSGNNIYNRIMNKPVAQKWLAAEMEKMSNEARWTFEEKLRTLKRIATAAVPDDAKTIDSMVPSSAISAIAEANKMQGHYSAEKHVNVNVDIDTDMEEVKRITNELLEKNKRAY